MKALQLIKNILLYIWQLPQNLIGLLLVWIYKPTRSHKLDNGVTVYYSNKMSGGISLGNYSIVMMCHYRKDMEESLKRDTVRHEAIGHALQSKILGPLYLLVIGLPSITWAGLYGTIIKPTPNGYYKFYTEKWADKIANVQR
jgi:hypothetical protein